MPEKIALTRHLLVKLNNPNLLQAIEVSDLYNLPFIVLFIVSTSLAFFNF